MWNGQWREDARSLILIGVSACAGLLVTTGIVAVSIRGGAHRDVRVRVARAAYAPTPDRSGVITEPLTADGPLYGRVLTQDGREYTGFIRWDRNEGTWTDFLDAAKDARDGGNQSGIRFGHVQRIDVIGRNEADLLLRSGESVRMSGLTTDLGSGMRALVVEDLASGTVELGWGDVRWVHFELPPAALRSSEARLHGTLTTTDGRSFTGYVAWDTDEVFASDVLDGDDDSGGRQQISFGEIATIARAGSSSAEVVLTSGRQMILRGTNDVDSSIRGVAISDPRLGEVKVAWQDLDRVRFHEPDAAKGPAHFDGGRPIRGTVVTRGGESFTGNVRWDRDEAFTWEMLNGDADGLELKVEFGHIARIARHERGSTVELQDGRSFELTGSNDVSSENRGVVVETAAGQVVVPWREFVELRLDG